MKRSELNKLRRFVHRLKRESNGIAKRSDRDYKNAGHSNTLKGTGDEGWTKVFLLSGQSDGILYAAESLRLLLDTFKVEGEE